MAVRHGHLDGSTSDADTVARVMSALRREGVIDSGRRWSSTLDREALDERAVEV